MKNKHKYLRQKYKCWNIHRPPTESQYTAHKKTLPFSSLIAHPKEKTVSLCTRKINIILKLLGNRLCLFWQKFSLLPNDP